MGKKMTPARAELALIRLYQKRVSPLMTPRCKYLPTCSQYAYEAVEKYGALRGSLMGALRVLRCNPFSKGGIDLVP